MTVIWICLEFEYKLSPIYEILEKKFKSMHKITSQDIQEVHSRKKKKSLKSSLPTFHPALSQPEDSKESWHFFSKYSLGSLTTHSILPRPPKL